MFRNPKSKNEGFSFSEHPYSELPLLIVSGVGRSGTTILRNCIAAHSKIQCRNAESNYLHDLMRAATVNEEKPSRIPALPVTGGEYWELHRQFVLHLLWPVDRTAQTDLPQMISTYSMLDPRAAIGLEKAFPSLSIFYIVRNGIEVVSSYQAFEPFQDLSFEDVCTLWALRQDMHQYGRDRTNMELFRFEWFHEPEKFASRLEQALERIGLPFDSKCLHPLGKRFHPTRFPGESKSDAHDLSKRSERWRLWTDRQRDFFVETCQPLMCELGYPIPWQ